jgi:predicted lipid-binding transport protein (Tim44 family)
MNVPQKPGLLARILLTLSTVALVIVGFFFLTAALIAGALLALVVGVRLWWTLRKLKSQMAASGRTSGTSSTSGTLEGEFQVVERESGAQQLPPAPPANNTPPAP